jgi:hypothetical protein
MGEHTRELLAGLAYTSAQVDALYASAAVA